METIEFEEIDSSKVDALLEEKKSFEIIGLTGRMTKAVTEIENKIESKKLSCRIYTKGRVAAAGGSFFGGVTGVIGFASAIGMAAHNLATFNPDYEIAKHVIDNKLSVTYKKQP